MRIASIGLSRHQRQGVRQDRNGIRKVFLSIVLLVSVGEAMVYGYGNCIMAACTDVGYSVGEGGEGGDGGDSSSSDAMKKKIAQHTGVEPQRRQRYAVSDLPSAHKRVVVYTDRVISVYNQVLHCLIENGGKARERNNIRTAAARIVATIKRKRMVQSANRIYAA